MGSLTNPTPATPPGNVNADTHPAIVNAANDEFESGSTLDTTGTRFSGATPWTIQNPQTCSFVVQQGSLSFLAPPASTQNTAITQPVPAATPYTYNAKFWGCTTDTAVAIAIGALGTGKFLAFGVGINGASLFMSVWEGTALSSVLSSVANVAITNYSAFQAKVAPHYLQVNNDGTNINFSFSESGVPKSYMQFFTQAISAFLVAAPVNLGLLNFGIVGSTSVLCCDWWRRTA